MHVVAAFSVVVTTPVMVIDVVVVATSTGTVNDTFFGMESVVGTGRRKTCYRTVV